MSAASDEASFVSGSEGGAFDAFDQIVGALDAAVGDSGGVPVSVLCPPAPQGAPEPVDLFGQARVLEVGSELVHCGGADLGAADVIDGSQTQNSLSRASLASG